MHPIVLVHGGLWEPMDADRFWHRPGIVPALAAAGYDVVAPDRPINPPSWDAELAALAGHMPRRPALLVTASNACALAVGLARAHPVAGLILAWPATAGDPAIDEALRARLIGEGASPDDVAAVLAGETLRGTSDVELARLRVPVGVVSSAPPNRVHQRRTVDALLRVVPGAIELLSCPEPPRPEFTTADPLDAGASSHRDRFVAALRAFADRLAP